MTDRRERSRACDRISAERFAQLTTSVLSPGPDTHTLGNRDLGGLLLEIQGRRNADPTIDELTALVDIRDRLDRILTSGLANDPSALLAKKYLDRVLATFHEPARMQKPEALMIKHPKFVECESCAAKPGSPYLCRSCLHNRATINGLREESEELTKVYVLAARLRMFPVPFDDHFQLVGAVDACRSVLEAPINDDDSPAPDNVSDWQEHVATYPREELLAAFREAHGTLHQLWTAAVDKEGYDKALWKVLDNALARFARDAAEKVGISRSEPLL